MSNTPIEDEENGEDGEDGESKIPIPDDNAQLSAKHLQETSAALSLLMGDDQPEAAVEKKVEDFITDDEYDDEDDGEVMNDVPPPKEVKSALNRPKSKSTGFEKVNIYGDKPVKEIKSSYG